MIRQCRHRLDSITCEPCYSGIDVIIGRALLQLPRIADDQERIEDFDYKVELRF